MSRLPPSIGTIEKRFLGSFEEGIHGLGPTRLVARYVETQGVSEKTAWTHFGRLKDGMAKGTVKRIVSFTGPDGERFGDARDEKFLERKADAETKTESPPAIWHLGGWYQNCPVRLSWEYCPVKNRLRQVAVVRVGVADFMRCHICNRFHFLGLSPKVRESRPQVWELDPAICWQDYEDELSVELMVDPETHKSQQSQIERVRRGGRWIGLRLRLSWDEDPYKRMLLVQWQDRLKKLEATTNVPVEG